MTINMNFIQANFELDRLVNKPNIKILKNRVSLEILFPFEFLEFVKNNSDSAVSVVSLTRQNPSPQSR